MNFLLDDSDVDPEELKMRKLIEEVEQLKLKNVGGDNDTDASKNEDHIDYRRNSYRKRRSKSTMM